jgi:predicted alpha/beta superfamily hydrolase
MSPSRRSLLTAPAALALTAAAAACASGPRAPAAQRWTRSASVSLFETDFPVPQLGRSRTIRLYLPPGYQDSGRRYRVLYMLDGQNLFDGATSFAGEWGIDDTLDRLVAEGDSGAIVIGIDNGGPARAEEYHPILPEGGPGKADAFVNFLCQTLKPEVDLRLRTLTGPGDTAIIGASSGATLALHAAFTRPDVFGLVGALSAPLWLPPAPAREVMTRRPVQPWSRVALISGAREFVGDYQPGVFAAGLEPMRAALFAAGYAPGQLLIEADPEGQHGEAFWGRVFGRVYQFLTGGPPAS